jgi:hypothetical protein
MTPWGHNPLTEDHSCRQFKILTFVLLRLDGLPNLFHNEYNVVLWYSCVSHTSMKAKDSIAIIKETEV